MITFVMFLLSIAIFFSYGEKYKTVTKKPYGPKMCMERCDSLVWCRSCKYTGYFVCQFEVPILSWEDSRDWNRKQKKSCQHPSKTAKHITNCDELPLGSNSGMAYLVLPGRDDNLEVFCDMNNTGSNWLVIQRRTDGSLSFNQTWDNYRDGFGCINDEFWLGNYYLHILTSTWGKYTLRMDIEYYNNKLCSANFYNFEIASEEEGFKLRYGGYEGKCGNLLSLNKGHQFATYDRGNDRSTEGCSFTSGWWFYSCASGSLNANYNLTGEVFTFHGKYPPALVIKSAEVKIRISS